MCEDKFLKKGNKVVPEQFHLFAYSPILPLAPLLDIPEWLYHQSEEIVWIPYFTTVLMVESICNTGCSHIKNRAWPTIKAIWLAVEFLVAFDQFFEKNPHFLFLERYLDSSHICTKFGLFTGPPCGWLRMTVIHCSN
jgi:hypothetical protein